MKPPVTKYSRKGNVHTIDFGIPAMGTLVIDYDQVPKEERAGIAKALLSVSTLACYVSTLGIALETRGADFSEISAEANLVLGQNDNSQARITGIDLDASVTLSGDDDEIFERCQKIMRNGCLVTASIHEGIHMNYTLSPDYED